MKEKERRRKKKKEIRRKEKRRERERGRRERRRGGRGVVLTKVDLPRTARQPAIDIGWALGKED